MCVWLYEDALACVSHRGRRGEKRRKEGRPPRGAGGCRRARAEWSAALSISPTTAMAPAVGGEEGE
eukprot:scaffold187726_cov22-Tisochrysis_lutea.AAC.1